MAYPKYPWNFTSNLLRMVVTKMWPHLWWKIVKIHEASWNLQLGPTTWCMCNARLCKMLGETWHLLIGSILLHLKCAWLFGKKKTTQKLEVPSSWKYFHVNNDGLLTQNCDSHDDDVSTHNPKSLQILVFNWWWWLWLFRSPIWTSWTPCSLSNLLIGSTATSKFLAIDVLRCNLQTFHN